MHIGRGYEIRFSILRCYDFRSVGRDNGTLYPTANCRQYLWFDIAIFCVGVANCKIVLGGRYRKLVSQYNGFVFRGTSGRSY